MVVNCIRNRFQQKEYIETLQTMEILLLKALCEVGFGRELQQMPSFITRPNWKLWYILLVKNKLEKKDAIKIISSLNASQKLLVSEVLKLVKLINSTRHECCQWKIVFNITHSQNLPAIIYHISSIYTYKEKAYKLTVSWSRKPFLFRKLLSLFHPRADTSPESLPKVLLRGPRH